MKRNMIERIKNWLGSFNLFGNDAPSLLGAARASDWREFRERYKRIRSPICTVFGCKSKQVQLHHVESFATKPEREKDIGNVVWLCQGIGTPNHHFWWGHLGSWLSLNEKLREWLDWVESRPAWDFEKQAWVYSKED